MSIRVKTRSYSILVALRHTGIKRGKLSLAVDVREAFQESGWGWDMLFLFRSLLRLPVTYKVRKNVAVTF